MVQHHMEMAISIQGPTALDTIASKAYFLS